jgi:hypothetical protein
MSLTRVATAKSTKSAKSLRPIEDDVDHIRKKFELLEKDRTGFWENAEKTKKRNHDFIEELKEENKKLKRLRNDVQNKRSSTAGSAGLSRTTSAGFLTNEMKEEAFWKKKLDDLKNHYSSKKKHLITLQDKLNEVNDNKFGGPEESPLTRTIRILENRLDKVMIKYNEAQSIRKTYEQIVKRLKEERVGYDNQLAAIERSLKGKEHDFEELLLLAHDATHAKELAQAELKKYDMKKSAVRKLRDDYLDDKKKSIQAKDDVIQKLERKDRDNGEKSNEKINPQSYASDVNFITGDTGAYDTNQNKQKLQDFEEAFKKIYEVTGVADVNEIIQKFTTQDETSKSLNDLKQEYIEKIEYLTNEKSRIKAELNSLKYEGGENMSRKQLDEIESNVNNVTNKCERSKLKYERVYKILVNAKAGIEHLVEKLAFFKLENKSNVQVNDDTLVEALAQCVEKLKLIYQVVRNDPVFAHEDLKRLETNVRSAPGTLLSQAFINNPITSGTLNLMDKSAKIEQVFSNKRVAIGDKEDAEVTDDEIDDDFDNDFMARIKEKAIGQMKNADKNKMKKKDVKKGKDK